MAGLDSSIYGNLKPPAQMSLGDMMNFASTAQAYKQAQQVNPETLRTATANAQSAEQTAATGGIDLQIKQQSNDERLALQDFFKDPENYQTDGQMDLGKINATVPKIAPLTGPKYIETLTSLNKSQTEANSATQDFSQKTRGIVAGSIGALGRAGINDPKVYISELNKLKNDSPQDKALAKYADAQIEYINALGPKANISAGAVFHSNELLSPTQQNEQFNPKATVQDVGGQFRQLQTTPTSITGTPGSVKIENVLAAKTLSPQVVSSPSNAPVIMGGGMGTNVGGNVSGINVGGGNISTTQSTAQPSTGQKSIPYVPGEPYDAFRTRAADVAKLIPQSAQALNINNVDSIPNAKFTNEKVQHLLDNPNLNIGPIADAISKQTGGIGLSADQQEIAKYLEQRIRMESARTNQDQTSQRTAFGSFGTQKAALREILYKDQGNLTGQELYQRGILNHAGDINNPNFQAVNKFNADYAKLNDPKVAHLMGVIGDKSISDLSKVDRQHLAKEFPGLSLAQSKALFDKRQQLLDLVGGK